MKIQIERNILQAMHLLSGKDESRYVLCGTLNFEVTKERCIIIASDGRLLGAIMAGQVIEPPEQEIRATVAIDQKMLKALPRPDKCPDVILDFTLGEHGAGTVKISPKLDPSVSFEHKLIEGNFPAWRHAIPKGTLPSPIDPSFNWTLLDRFAQAGKLLRGSSDPNLRLRQADALSPMLVKLTNVPNFIGCLMPLRTDSESRAPDWATLPEPPAPTVGPDETQATTQPVTQ